MRILANDGIDDAGKTILENAGFEVDTIKIDQENLINLINNYDAIIIRSATKIKKDLLDKCTNLKAIGRAGVGMDNIDVEYARAKGIKVLNTPAASSRSVAELVFCHLLAGARFVAETNRGLSNDANANFNALKKTASSGIELHGKTLGIIGFGRIGQACAKIGIGMGMKISYFDPYLPEVNISIELDQEFGIAPLILPLTSMDEIEDVLKIADFLTLHIPGGAKPVIGENEIKLMKRNAGLINCSRGGIVDEKALYNALVNGKLAFAGLDVFETEPPVNLELTKLKNISLSPHIGASTIEAQERVGIEMATKMIEALK